MAFWNINAILHYNVITFISKGTKVFSGPFTDCPHFITGIDIIYDQAYCLLLQDAGLDRFGNVYIKFCVVSKYKRNVNMSAQDTCQNSGHKWTVAVDQITVD